MAAGSSNNMEQIFTAFAKFGDSKSDGKGITLTNADKWMKQAKVVDGKKITTTDTGICFNKMKSKTLNYQDFTKYLDLLAEYKKVDAQELKAKLTNCGLPGQSNVTQAVHVGGVDRLTDTSKYTGSHKERFDESGKGKGIEGRADVSDNKGYVQGYKEKDTYDKSHK